MRRSAVVPALVLTAFALAAVAHDSAETVSDYASTLRQITDDPPSIPEPLAPIGDSIVYARWPTFSWTSSTDPDPFDTVTYTFWITPDRDCTYVFIIPDLTDTVFDDYLPYETGKRHWWTVTATDNHGHSTPVADAERLRLYKPGDVNASWSVTASDVITIVNYVFKGGTLIVPECAARINGDDVVNASDVIALVDYVFKNGPAPRVACVPDLVTYFPMTLGSYWIYDYIGDAKWTVISRTDDTAVIFRPGNDWMTHGGTIKVSGQGHTIDIDLPGEGWVPFYRFETDTSWLHHDLFPCDDSILCVLTVEPDPVITPAGTFSNCLRLDRLTIPSCADAGTLHEWWAPNVGLVQWEESSYTGPRTYQLQAYHIVSE